MSKNFLEKVHNYGRCSEISNTSCPPKRPTKKAKTNKADPDQTASEEAV